MTSSLQVKTAHYVWTLEEKLVFFLQRKHSHNYPPVNYISLNDIKENSAQSFFSLCTTEPLRAVHLESVFPVPPRPSMAGIKHTDGVGVQDQRWGCWVEWLQEIVPTLSVGSHCQHLPCRGSTPALLLRLSHVAHLEKG